jgi:L-lactate dehydrogenase complex protein LldE
MDGLPVDAGGVAMAEFAGQTQALRVALFVTCLGDVFYPEVGEATVHILRRLGIDVAFPLAQTCCGQPAFNAGFRRHAKAVARRNFMIFADYDYIIVPSGSCTAMFRVFYAELFADEPERAEQAKALAQRTYELSEFLVKVLGIEQVGAVFPGKVAYHASCHLLRELGVTDAPRRLMAHVQGTELLPLDLEGQCCGFGGTFAVKYAEISDAMLGKKIASIKRAGVDTVVSCDAGCLMHIAGRLHRQGEAVRVMHLAELLNARAPAEERQRAPGS